MKLLVLVSLFMTTIYSWWEVGHMLTAQIAELELKKNYPGVYEHANKLVTAMGDLADGNNLFISSATWPDQIKDKAMNFLDPWHYYDRPYNPTGQYLIQEEGASHFNALDCLSRARYELTRNPNKINFPKVMFIRYVLHVIGDVHQPLHSTTYFNKTYQSPLGDIGGNLERIITTQGVEMVYHAYWDSGATYFQKPDSPEVTYPLSDEYRERILMQGEEIMSEYEKEYFGDLSYNMDVDYWTEESYHYAQNTTYPLIMEQKQLTSTYHKNAVKLCKQRVALAGYRLAHFLVDLFGQDYEKEKFFGQSKYNNIFESQKQEIRKIGDKPKPSNRFLDRE